MITKQQIKVLYKNRWISEPVYAVLDCDFESCFLGYTLPAGTIVEIKLQYVLVVVVETVINGELIDINMDPNYLTLLNPPVCSTHALNKPMKATHAFAVVVMFGLLMYLGASWIWAH